jgi:hypothetical protein
MRRGELAMKKRPRTAAKAPPESPQSVPRVIVVRTKAPPNRVAHVMDRKCAGSGRDATRLSENKAFDPPIVVP